MRSILMSPLLIFMIFSQSAWAQFSVQETFNASGLTFSAFNLLSTEVDQTQFDQQEEGTGRIATYSFLTAATRLTYDLKGGVRLPFVYNTAGTDRFNGDQVQNSEFFLQDLIFFLRDDSIALLPWDVSVFWEGRAILPTGKFSQQQGMIGAYRNQFIFNKVLTQKISLEYDQRITYNHHSRTAYLNRFENARGETIEVASLTKAWDLAHRVQGWYRFDADTGVGLQMSFEDDYYNSSLANASSSDRSRPLTKEARHVVKLGPALRFSLSPKINFILNYADTVIANENMSELGQFKAENSEVALLSFIRF